MGTPGFAKPFHSPLSDTLPTDRPGAGVHRKVVAHGPHNAYALTRTRAWLEPKIAPWLARVSTGPRKRQQLLDNLNEAFGLKHLRPIPDADLAAADDAEADFKANIDRSILPAWVDLARQHNIRLVFVKILRRPDAQQQPVPETPALRQYTQDLRAWLEARGMVFFDDRDNPGMWTLPYADGDHTDSAAMTPYAELLAAQLEKIK